MNTHHIVANPRALPLDERRASKEHMADDQAHWLSRLAQLVEPPVPTDDFPAFLLATPTFAELAQRIGSAKKRADLTIETADELDWFMAKFADYLRTCDGEDSFATNQKPSH
mgnify:CR=1 FL=1